MFGCFRRIGPSSSGLANDVIPFLARDTNENFASETSRPLATSSLAHSLRVRKITIRSPKHFLLGLSWGRLVGSLVTPHRPITRTVLCWTILRIYSVHVEAFRQRLPQKLLSVLKPPNASQLLYKVKETWTHEIFCLSNPEQNAVPNKAMKTQLQETGLGRQKNRLWV